MNIIYGINSVAEALKARGRAFEWVGVAKERHDLRLQAIGGVAVEAVRTLLTRPAGGDDDAIALAPARHARTEFGNGAGCLVALGHHRQEGRKRSVDQAEVGMTDAAERDLDEDFAGAGLGDRNILDRDLAGVRVEALSAHRGGHGGTNPR